MKSRIYLDYAATTPVDEKVLATMLPYFDVYFGNAASIHGFGREAKDAVDKSREIAAMQLGCEKRGVIFTSGATESNNLAVKGVLYAMRSLKKYQGRKFHFITTNIEHHCVLDSFTSIKEEFPEEAEVTYLEVDKDGLINPEDVRSAIKENTVLISIMFVNNEIGTVEPLKEIGAIIADIRKTRGRDDLPLYFHSDATQAFSYFDCNMEKLGLDMVTLSAHKIYGPKGAGLLGVKKGTILKAVQHGGGQESNLRSGTLNVPGIVGLGSALELASIEREKLVPKLQELRDYFIKKVEAEIEDAVFNGSRESRSPNNANFSFSGAEGESVVLMLDQAGVAVSTGSACSSGSLAPSHVQMALSGDHLRAHSSIRFSLGKFTTKEELDYTVDKLKNIIAKLRSMSKEIKI